MLHVRQGNKLFWGGDENRTNGSGSKPLRFLLFEGSIGGRTNERI